jgi:hypothetical protein
MFDVLPPTSRECDVDDSPCRRRRRKTAEDEDSQRTSGLVDDDELHRLEMPSVRH